MSVFFVALTEVAVLLLCVVPGYLLFKKKMLGEECIPGVSKILLFACQPCLSVYTFTATPFSWAKLADMGVFALIVIGIHALMLVSAFLIFGKHGAAQPIYRIMTIGTTFGNCAFFGIPVIEALLPDIAPDLIVYTTVYAAIMNILGWTVGSAIIARDVRYISVKKIFLNPAMIGTLVALALFILQIPLPTELSSMVTLVGRMATPLSMIVMGMRLATMNFAELFTKWRLYLTVAIKQFIMPLVTFGVAMLLPLDPGTKQALFIISACPIASIVLNFSEIVGEGQRDAANLVLLGTGLSIVTLPIMMLLLPLLA